uniref:Uncharacterized protein n=1 Tax=Arundo donax TaxID=35708 RepID=A0A0A9D731_ARUDO
MRYIKKKKESEVVSSSNVSGATHAQLAWLKNGQEEYSAKMNGWHASTAHCQPCPKGTAHRPQHDRVVARVVPADGPARSCAGRRPRSRASASASSV